MITTCGHPKADAAWYPQTKAGKCSGLNEDGWRCILCFESLGFRPDLDLELTDLKVHGLITDLHDRHWVYISNGTEGETICENVVARCRAEDRYDQVFILAAILNAPNVLGDGAYWREQRNRWLMERPDAPEARS